MSIVRYTIIRLALIGAFAGLFYVLGMRSYLLAFTAILCGAMAGFIFFPKQSHEAAASVEALVAGKDRRTKKADAIASDEDVEDEFAEE